MDINAFDKSLKMTYKALYLSGLSVLHDDTKLVRAVSSLIFYANLFWLHTDVLGEIYWLIEGIQKGKSFSELSLIAPCTFLCFLASAKAAPLYYHRRLFRKVISELKNIHPKDNNGDSTNIFNRKHYIIQLKSINGTIKKNNNDRIKENHAIIHTEDAIENSTQTTKEFEFETFTKSTKMLNIFINMQVFSFVAVVIFFLGIPITAMGYEYHTKKEINLKLPFLIKYFFDPFTMSRWPFVYVHQAWSTFVVVFNIFGADSFIYAFCTFMQLHFRILCYHYRNVVCESSEETWSRLLYLIKRHQELIKLVDKMEIMYSKSTLFNILVSSVLICLCGFNVVFIDDMGAFFAFMSFLVMNVSQISLLCLFGDMLMLSSTKLSEAIYKSRWYDTDERNKRTLLFIMARAQKPCKLTAWNFADLNLKAFTTILSRSWSYFALLKTIYK